MTDSTDVRRGCSPPVCHRPTWEDVVDDLGEDPDRWLVIGPDRAANLLDVIVLITAKGEDLALSHGGHGLSLA